MTNTTSTTTTTTSTTAITTTSTTTKTTLSTSLSHTTTSFRDPHTTSKIVLSTIKTTTTSHLSSHSPSLSSTTKTVFTTRDPKTTSILILSTVKTTGPPTLSKCDRLNDPFGRWICPSETISEGDQCKLRCPKGYSDSHIRMKTRCLCDKKSGFCDWDSEGIRCIPEDSSTTDVSQTSAPEYTCPSLNEPHGVWDCENGNDSDGAVQRSHFFK